MGVAQKCSTVVNSWRRWPKSVGLSSMLCLDGAKVQYCRQFLASVAQQCSTVVNYWPRRPKSAALSSPRWPKGANGRFLASQSWLAGLHPHGPDQWPASKYGEASLINIEL